MRQSVCKFANNQPESHRPTRRHQGGGAIREQSGGRLDIQIFPNNQSGSDTDMLSQVRSGGWSSSRSPPLRLADIIADAGISGLGFIFPDYDAVWKAMDGELGAFVRPQMRQGGLVAMPRSGTTASATSRPATGRSRVPPTSRT